MKRSVLSQHNKPEWGFVVGNRIMLWTWLAAAVLVVAAGALRAVHLDQPLLNFHATRQYRSALIARACYFDRHPDIPDSMRQVADAARALQPAGEPPVMEWLACATYLFVGHETLSAARAYTAFFWLLGAIPFLAVARRLGSSSAALVGLALYLFLPYGVVASRAFQPDALMTCCILWSLLALVRYYEQQRQEPGTTRSHLLIASLGIAVAAVVKPMSVFITVPAAVRLAIAASGVRAAAFGPRMWAPVLIGLAPAVAYYGYGALFGTLARDQMRLRFVPSLLGTPFFFGGLATQVQRVFGVPVFVAALVGTALAMRGRPRLLLSFLWLGYAAFAVAFTYHMPTHDYYHLPYVALAGFATTALVDRLRNPMLHVSLAVVLAVGWSLAVWPRLLPGNLPARVRDYERIGDLTNHTSRAVFLDLEYGYPLMYHGLIAGDAWPTTDDLAAESMGGAEPVDATTRFDRDYNTAATHFIVTDVESLEAQPDLQTLLAARATPVAQTPTFHVYQFTAH